MWPLFLIQTFNQKKIVKVENIQKNLISFSFGYPTSSTTVTTAVTHLSNQNYEICIRRAAGYCLICYRYTHILSCFLFIKLVHEILFFTSFEFCLVNQLCKNSLCKKLQQHFFGFSDTSQNSFYRWTKISNLNIKLLI